MSNSWIGRLNPWTLSCTQMLIDFFLYSFALDILCIKCISTTVVQRCQEVSKKYCKIDFPDRSKDTKFFFHNLHFKILFLREREREREREIVNINLIQSSRKLIYSLIFKSIQIFLFINNYISYLYLKERKMNWEDRTLGFLSHSNLKIYI